MILVTGGAGFIGSNFILNWLGTSRESVVNLDKLTYAGNLENLDSLKNDPRHIFIQCDINDQPHVENILAKYQPRAIIHFAAESHVDRSIHGPTDFIQTNINGTFHLLEAVRAFWAALSQDRKEAFRFVQVSTDEVYGSLGARDSAFVETTAYAPNSPYSASKAAADHLARAYHHTYNLPILTTNCSNNYGPYQFPEKLIPLMILHALAGKALPIYGDGLNVRDWLYVGDHCDAINVVLEKGRIGETYNIGGESERTNLQVVESLCEILDELIPDSPHRPHRTLITKVADRPGHDRRYAINSDKIRRECGWRPRHHFTEALRRTVIWYLDNSVWVEHVTSGAYRRWITENYLNRS